jgi:hypothetical protein
MRIKEVRISTLGIGGEAHSRGTLLHMVKDCPVVKDPVLFDQFMKGDFSDQMGIESFMKEGTFLQCDEFVSRDMFHEFLGIIWLMEGVYTTFMGIHFLNATLEFRNDVSSPTFPHRSVTTEALVLLTWEAIMDAMNTIKNKEKDDRFELTLDNRGCAKLLKRYLLGVVAELKNKDKRQEIHEQLAMNAEQRNLIRGKEGISCFEVEDGGKKDEVQDDVRKNEFANDGRCGICIYDVLYKLGVKNRAGYNMFCQRKEACSSEHRELHTVTVSEVKEALCGCKDSLRDSVEKAVDSKIELFRV